MEGKRFLKLNDVIAYKVSFHLSNYIWNLFINRDYFIKDTIGKQFVRAIDSVSANIAEGFGRYNKKDKIKFYYYSFGSLKESFDWNEKAYFRQITDKKQYDKILIELNKLPKEINCLIKITRDKLAD